MFRQELLVVFLKGKEFLKKKEELLKSLDQLLNI